jgi:septum formation protein
MGIISIKPTVPIILASASKIRAEILKNTGLLFSVKISDVNEDELKKKLLNKSIQEEAKILACEKASTISEKNPNEYIIGADQICSLNNKIYSKPITMDNAIQQLSDLSGKTHKQTSAICLYYKNELVWSYVDEALLTMHELNDTEITRYLELDKPLNSCGSYKYESLGCHLFSKVTGQSETIQGFPIIPLLAQLRKNKLYSLIKK